MKLIDKSTLVAEIERRIASLESIGSENYLHDNCPVQYAMLVTLKSLKFSIDTLKVKEVDLEEEVKRYDMSEIPYSFKSTVEFAKHFFELGLNASNPIAEVNLEALVRQVNDLSLEAGKHYDSVIKEERKKYGGSDLAINLLCGTIDAKELCIQYVLDKLKVQKGE